MIRRPMAFNFQAHHIPSTATRVMLPFLTLTTTAASVMMETLIFVKLVLTRASCVLVRTTG